MAVNNKDKVSFTSAPDNPVAMKWEDLYELRNVLIQDLGKQSMTIISFYDMVKDILNKDPSALSVYNGTLKAYKEISDEIYELSKYHVTLDDNNNVIDYKQGVISSDAMQTEWMDYTRLYTTYTDIAAKLEDLTVTSTANVLTYIQSKNVKDENGNLLVTEETIDKINKVYIDGQKKLVDANKELLDAMIGKKPKKGKNNGKRKSK